MDKKKINKNYIDYLKEQRETSTLKNNNKKRKKSFWKIFKSLLIGK
tara:strand:- start:262 stop:399 length:138 start_codon:yes stop_codon:yes gene_type:complete